MHTGRYIPCLCYIDRENKIIPYWQLEFADTEDYGPTYKVKGQHQHTSTLTECYWDSAEKKVLLGKVKDHYPENLGFKVGETVLVELSGSHKTLQEDQIESIVFEEYEIQVYKIKNVESYQLNWWFTPEEQQSLKLSDLYEIRSWKPYYKLKSGQLIKWAHQLYHKA